MVTNMRHTVLVVDDEPMIRWTLNESLRSWGYVVLEAGTINAALLKVAAEHPTIILLDINLPDGSGLDALLEIKKRQQETIVNMNT